MQPWERTLDESPQAHAAFLAYMHAGASGRSLAKVARSLGKSTALLEGWSSKHAWQQRVAEWDEFLAEQAVHAAVDEVREMSRRRRAGGDVIVAVAHQRIVELVNDQDLARIPVGQLPRWAHVGVLIGRLARGAASEVVAGESAAAAEASGRTLGDLFAVPDGGEVSELTVARLLVERSRRPSDGEDLDAELVDLLDPSCGEEPEEDPDDDDPAELRPAAVVPTVVQAEEPDPEPVVDPAEEQARAWQYLRQNPHRPTAGPELVAWLRARKVVGLDQEPQRAPRRRRRRR